MATLKTFDGVESVSSNFVQIDPRSIKVEEGFNKRTDWGDIEELSREIEEQGVLQPITLRTKKDDPETLWLVNGERRLKATMLCLERGVQIKTIPAQIKKNLSDEDALKHQFVLNDGKEFTRYEQGLVFQQFQNWGYKQTEIAKMFGRSNGHVNQCLALLNSPPEIKQALKNNEITANQAKKVLETAKGNTEKAKEALEKAKRKEKITTTPKKKNEELMATYWTKAGKPSSVDMQCYTQLAAKSPDKGEGRAFLAGMATAMASILKLDAADIPGYLLEGVKK